MSTVSKTFSFAEILERARETQQGFTFDQGDQGPYVELTDSPTTRLGVTASFEAELTEAETSGEVLGIVFEYGNLHIENPTYYFATNVDVEGADSLVSEAVAALTAIPDIASRLAEKKDLRFELVGDLPQMSFALYRHMTPRSKRLSPWSVIAVLVGSGLLSTDSGDVCQISGFEDPFEEGFFDNPHLMRLVLFAQRPGNGLQVLLDQEDGEPPRRIHYEVTSSEAQAKWGDLIRRIHELFPNQ